MNNSYHLSSDGMALAMKPGILVAFDIYEDGLEILKDVGEISWRPQIHSEKEMIREISGKAAVVLGTQRVDARVMDAGRELEVVGRHGVGHENVDLAAATQRGIVVTWTPGVLWETVADLTFGLILSVMRIIASGDRLIRSKRWKPVGFLGRDPAGKTLGILGLGNIGSRVARRARAFGLKVIHHDLVVRRQIESELEAEQVTMEKLLTESDIVSIHTPLTENTFHLMGEKELSMMKKGAFLINTARGSIVDETALIKALREGTIAGAGLDVFEEEPIYPDNPLLQMDNVVLTPHLGSSTVETRRNMALRVAEDVARVLSGQRPLYPLNPEVLNRKK